jgi:SET domain-containing protein
MSKGRMSARERSELVRMTIILPAGDKGMGLFARVDIPKGVVVSRMREPARMKRSEVAAYQRRYHRLPDDFIIYVPRSSLVFYDRYWTGENRPPRWYKMNHSAKPNTAPVVLDASLPPREQEVAWITTKNVKAGDELTFEYTDVPDDWE